MKKFNRIYYHECTLSHPNRVKMTFLGYPLPKIKGRILDWGCSKGDTTDDLSNLYPEAEIMGIDINSSCIREAVVSRKKGKFLVADGFNLPFPRGSFNGVFCLNNLYYTLARSDNMRQLSAVFMNIRRMLENEGYLFISGETEDEMPPNYAVLKRAGAVIKPKKIRFDDFGEAKRCLERLLEMCNKPLSDS